MSSLTSHLIARERHAQLPFRTDCPLCREQRLAGRLSSPGGLAPGRATAVALAGTLALGASAPLPAALAQTPAQAPDPDGPDETVDATTDTAAPGEPTEEDAPPTPEQGNPAEAPPLPPDQTPPVSPPATGPPPAPAAVDQGAPPQTPTPSAPGAPSPPAAAPSVSAPPPPTPEPTAPAPSAPVVPAPTPTTSSPTPVPVRTPSRPRPEPAANPSRASRDTSELRPVAAAQLPEAESSSLTRLRNRRSRGRRPAADAQARLAVAARTWSARATRCGRSPQPRSAARPQALRSLVRCIACGASTPRESTRATPTSSSRDSGCSCQAEPRPAGAS